MEQFQKGDKVKLRGITHPHITADVRRLFGGRQAVWPVVSDPGVDADGNLVLTVANPTRGIKATLSADCFRRAA